MSGRERVVEGAGVVVVVVTVVVVVVIKSHLAHLSSTSLSERSSSSMLGMVMMVVMMGMIDLSVRSHPLTSRVRSKGYWCKVSANRMPKSSRMSY